MANTYTWNILSMDRYPSGQQPDLVYSVEWSMTGINGIHRVDIRGTQNIEYNSDNNHVPYAELTADIVIKWVQDSLGADQVSAIKQDIDQKLSELVNPPAIVGAPPPWQPYLS
jgi:hypothetical protein